MTGKSLNYQKEAGELASPGPGWGRAIRPPVPKREKRFLPAETTLHLPNGSLPRSYRRVCRKEFHCGQQKSCVANTSPSSRGGSLTAKSLNYRSKAGELTALAQDGGELLSPPPS